MYRFQHSTVALLLFFVLAFVLVVLVVVLGPCLPRGSS